MMKTSYLNKHFYENISDCETKIKSLLEENETLRKNECEDRNKDRSHDHIIRDQKSFENISNYIRNNPAKWEEDKNCGELR